MLFYPENATIPERLTSNEFLIRPIRATDARSDYEALMSSKEMLRLWDQSDWPSDDFSLEENQSDLEEHEREHAAREAFTFTIQDPAQQRCLGCIYIYPMEAALRHMDASDADLEEIGDFEAYVTFWVRASELAAGLEGRLLTQILAWFEDAWHFRHTALGTNTEDLRQAALFREHNFAEKWRFPISGRDSANLIYSRESLD